MKIAFLRYPEVLYKSGKINRGGSEIANQQIIDFLRSNGDEVVEFSPTNPERVKLVGISGLGTPLMFQDLIKKIDKINRCDVLVSTNWFGAILPEVKIPCVTIFHSCASWLSDSVRNINQSETDSISRWAKRAKKYSLEHSCGEDLHERVIAVEEKYFAQNSNHVIAVSAALLDAMHKYYDFDENRASVINNPFASQWEEINTKKTFSNNMEIVCVTRMGGNYSSFVGKGGDRIMEILSRFQDKKINIAFSTDFRGYGELINEYLENANYQSNISHDGVGKLLAKSHISIHCSRCEACQMTLIESMYMKTVPITYEVGVAGELIDHGKNGFIVTSVDEAERIIKELYNDPDRAEKIANRARETAEKLSIERIGPKYQEILKRTIRTSAN